MKRKPCIIFVTAITAACCTFSFTGCITPNNDNSVIGKISEGLQYELNGDNSSYKVAGIGTCNDSAINIPATFNNLPVTSIKNFAFHRCSSITSVTIPEGVTYIDVYALSECPKLKKITIPDSVTAIAACAFSLSEGIIELKNNIEYVDNWAIRYDKLLPKELTLKTGTRGIANEAFDNYFTLESITIPNTVKSIGKYAFNKCSSLKIITIPNSVKLIGEYAFNECPMLKNAVFDNPNGWMTYIPGFSDIRIISSADLQDTALASTYLTETYYFDAWKRS